MDVLIVDDEKSVRESTLMAVESEGHYAEGVNSGQLAILRLEEEFFDVVFIDLCLENENGLDVLKEIRNRFRKTVPIMFTAFSSVETAVKAIQLGALDYLEKPFTPGQLRTIMARAGKQRKIIDSAESQTVETLKKQERTSGGDPHSPNPVFQSNDESMKGIYDILFKAAATSASILILGESGTGKSIAAKEIHQRSQLSDKPFVTVHCPSLSKELLESELFGHVKGAFTGAVKDKWGKVHAADGGTLFLDEIGELPIDLQPKLLRLLQEREYERVGETTTRSSDVRIIAATNRNLHREVEKGTFREDLYYRLNVISVEMPPLRERPDDLENLSNLFLHYFVEKSGRSIKGFSRSGKARLTGYRWPGNIRELRNALERAVILAEGNEINSEDLPSPDSGFSNDKPELTPGADATLEELEAEHLQRVLEKSGSLQEAAATLGIDQATLYRKRKKLGLN